MTGENSLGESTGDKNVQKQDRRRSVAPVLLLYAGQGPAGHSRGGEMNVDAVSAVEDRSAVRGMLSGSGYSEKAIDGCLGFQHREECKAFFAREARALVLPP